MACGPAHFDLRSIILIRCARGSPGRVAKQRGGGGRLLSAFRHQCKEICDESQVNMGIIINCVVMDRNALSWLGSQRVSGGGLPDVERVGAGQRGTESH